MSDMSDYLEDKLRRFLFRGESYTPPATLYFALYTAAPTDAGGGTEVSGNGYARASLAANTTNWSVGTTTDGLIENANAITWPTATGSWGTAVAVGVFDASSGGNLLFWKAISSTAISTGQTPTYTVGSFDVTFS